MASTTEIELLLKAKDESAGAFESFARRLDGVHNSILSVGKIAVGNILGNLGVQGIGAAVRSIAGLGASMIDANAQMEQMTKRLQVLYGSAAEAARAMAFLQQNEMRVPFNIADITQASTTLVGFGADLTQVLLPLEEVAAAMGQSLPLAAQALTDALAGRFAMMRRDLRIDKEMLVPFGLKMQGAKVDTSTILPSFEKFVAARYGTGLGPDSAIGQQARTFTGLMSSLESQLFYGKMNVGQGLFAVVKQQLADVVTYLQGHTQEVQRFELMVGAALGRAAQAAVGFGKAFGPYLGSAILLGARAWDLIHVAAANALQLAGTAVGAFGNWLQNTGFPAIQEVINALADAWIRIEPPIARVLAGLADAASGAFVAIAAQAGPLLQGLAGAFEIGLGAAEIIFDGGLTVLSGNWAKFGNTLNGGTNLIMVGFIDAFGGLAEAMVPLANQLIAPFDWLLHNTHTLATVLAAPFIATIAVANLMKDSVLAGMKLMANGIEAVLSGLGHLIPDIATKIPGIGGLIGGLKHDLINLKPFSITNPIDSITGAVGAANKVLGQFVPELKPWEHLTAGVSVARAQADIEARRKQILKELGLDQGGPLKGATFSTTGGPGIHILDQIKDLFKGLGGTMTLPDFMQLMGFTDLGRGMLKYTGPGGGAGPLTWNGGPLPVLGYRPPGEPAAASTAPLATAAKQVTGRVPLGELGATFGQTLATVADMRRGTDPATRAAQQTATAAQSQLSQGAKALTYAAEQAERTAAIHAVMVEVRDLLASLRLPGSTPPNPLQLRGVHRPGV